MKHFKVIGLAAVAAMALTAFLGAGSASATVLCKTQMTEGCAAAGWDYPIGTVIDASLEAETTLRLKNTSGTTLVTCTASTVKGETTNTGSATETVDGNASVLTFEGCDNPIHLVTPGSFEVHSIVGTDNGTVTANGVTVILTIFGVSCVYTTDGTHAGVATGGSMGTVDFNTVLKKEVGGFLCPETIIWNGAYTVTSPEPLYVSTS